MTPEASQDGGTAREPRIRMRVIRVCVDEFGPLHVPRMVAERPLISSTSSHGEGGMSMTRYPGDQGGNLPGPRDPRGPGDPRDPRGSSGFLQSDPREGFPGHPYAPGPAIQQGGPTIQPMQPIRAGRSGQGNEETAGFQDRAQYQLAPGTRLQGGRYVIESVIG